MLASRAAFSGLYFAVQRARGGVTPGQIEAAAAVLDSSWEACGERALALLSELHGEPRDWRWLEARAPVDRRDLLAAARDASRRPPRGVRVEVRRTSGSTGTPFSFPKDRRMTAWMDAAMWAVYSWHGVSPGVPHLRFWGMPLQRARRLRKQVSDRFQNRVRINAFELTGERVSRQFRAARRVRPSYAYGYPTLMRTFAQLCRTSGLDGRDLRLEKVISTGELLSPAARAELLTFFGCPVVNEYGCTESGIVAMECEHGTLHAVPVAVWPEVWAGPQAATLPGAGEVVISDLYGAVLPLVRYRLHDRASGRRRPCRCGRDLLELEVSSGRIDSFIATPRGPVYDAILAYTVPPEVQRFKVWQLTPTELRAEVVPARGFTEQEAAAAGKRAWEAALGEGVGFVVKAVADIPLEPSGKLRYFVPMPADAGEGDEPLR